MIALPGAGGLAGHLAHTCEPVLGRVRGQVAAPAPSGSPAPYRLCSDGGLRRAGSCSHIAAVWTRVGVKSLLCQKLAVTFACCLFALFPHL